MRNSLILALERQLRKEEEELHVAQEITENIFPALDTIHRDDMLNPVALKARLSQMKPQYRDAVYGLCRIATECGPEGSVIILDPDKVLTIIEAIEMENNNSYGLIDDTEATTENTEDGAEETLDPKEQKNKEKRKKIIFGLTSSIIKAIIKVPNSTLSILCKLVNSVIEKRITNTPPLKTVARKVTALLKQKTNSRNR